ncbi:hypothetical protein NIES39_E00270 [Arthrospira platensis NIES-39]|nr:hypothetical protein NIES39_E00270 [Arthrospira platensis NIES-39]
MGITIHSTTRPYIGTGITIHSTTYEGGFIYLPLGNEDSQHNRPLHRHGNHHSQHNL